MMSTTFMGEMADMLLDQIIDWDGDGENVGYRKELQCSHCNKRSLAWRKVNKKWVLFESNGNVHSCHSYEPSLDVLKLLAKDNQEIIRRDALWRLTDKAKKRGGLKKIINLISDSELIDLYACFVRDDLRSEVGMPVSYKNELKLLKDELLRRLSK